ncbi:MerR family copper efflux transcriptional regulator [Agrococcus sp. UYP10]|uniref:helix-turn-helix domain-containing protein n=1 Tax=Agrococcus sp. UYP10 TaxID=1756355 RepID=UPI0033944648
MRSSLLSIGELASEFGLEPHVLRHWESEGVLAPTTRVGGKRRYDDAARMRIGTILRGQDAGMSLAAIRAVLATSSAAERHAMLADQVAALEQRQAELEAALAVVRHLQSCEHSDFAQCPGFRELITAEPQPIAHSPRVHARARRERAAI